MTEERLSGLLAAHSLSDYAELILPHVRPTLYLTLGEAGEEVGRTRIGGSPDLPPAFEWPLDEDGDPYTFALQVNLADLPAFEGSPFPTKGLLSVFANLDMGQTNRAGVYLFPDTAACQRREQNHDGINEILIDVPPHHLNVVLGAGLPLWATSDEESLLEAIVEATPDADGEDEDRIRDAYEDLTQALPPAGTVVRMLGHASGIGQDPRQDAYVAREHNPEWLYNYEERRKLDMSQARHWYHFLTLNSSQELDLCIYDAGYWQLLIKDTDLAALNLNDIYAAVESS